jgi:hypothetical protein
MGVPIDEPGGYQPSLQFKDGGSLATGFFHLPIGSHDGDLVVLDTQGFGPRLFGVSGKNARGENSQVHIRFLLLKSF